MTSYVVRRVLLIVPTVFGALSFLFFLFFLLPGDPARLIAGGSDRTVDPGVIERVEERYGLDDPVHEQFTDFWSRTLRWDLGESFQTRRSVNEILGERAVNSIRLGIWAIAIEVVVGISVGVLSAIRRYTVSDKLTTIVTSAASAVPVFVLGFLLQYAFAVYPNLHDWPEWTRLRTSRLGPDTWTFFFVPTGEQWRYLLLPAVTLACVSTALAARMTRGSMLEVMGADYMRTARAKGLTERQVITRHGLRNAMLPVVTLIGIDFGTVIGVAVLTETVFSWPGLGSSIADAVLERDAPVLLGLTLVVVLVYAVINLLVDLSYAWLDPRVRLGRRGGR
jgi:ABC-type dipeptide/oligopeptide/nickel transport system permease component